MRRMTGEGQGDEEIDVGEVLLSWQTRNRQPVRTASDPMSCYSPHGW